MRVPKLATGRPAMSVSALYGYGLTYAVASLSCTIGPFLAVISASLSGSGLLGGLAVFVAYALGMGLVVTVLSLAVALARVTAVTKLRRVLPHVSRLSGALLVAAGLYVAYYGWYEVRVFDGGTLAGKPVVFWFWAPWCSKCRSDAPAVKAAVGKHQDVRFVGVAGLDTEPAMKEFVRSTGTGGFVHLSDRKGAVWTKLGVTQQSVFVFMKADGSTEKVTGPLGADGLAARIAKIQAG